MERRLFKEEHNIFPDIREFPIFLPAEARSRGSSRAE